MAGGPVVLLGQGEQYDDPDDWRELMRARRIRRGVEVAVRRDGLTALHRPENVPELAAVLDAVDPPGPPSATAVPTSAPPSRPATTVGGASTIADGVLTGAPPGAPPPAPGAPGAPGRASPPRARKRWPFGVWRWVIGAGVLLLLRFCAPEGFGPLPALGERAHGAAAQPSSAVCLRVRGWIARAACGDPELQRLRPALARAYAARAQATAPRSRPALAAAQGRWQEARSACRLETEPAACLEDRYRARLAELRAGG